MHGDSIVLLCLALSVNGATLAGPTETLPRTEALKSVEINSNVSIAQSSIHANHSNLCMTKGCVKTSAQILDFIDDNVNPCDNFYEFACGKFLRNTFIPDDKIAVMSFVNVQDKVQDQLRLMINERSLPNESKPFTLAKIFNTACMDLDTLEVKGECVRAKCTVGFRIDLNFRHSTDGGNFGELWRLAGGERRSMEQ